jgi:hypothetical protein
MVRMALYFFLIIADHSHRGLCSTTRTNRFTIIMIFLMFFILGKYKEIND